MINERLTAVKQAHYAYTHKDTMDRQARLDHAVALIEWGIYSNQQIVRFTGIDKQIVGRLAKKTDHTGGNLSGESLPAIIAIIADMANGTIDRNNFTEAARLGASTRMIGRLTGVSQRTVVRYMRPLVDFDYEVAA